jgi:hypothetical protein
MPVAETCSPRESWRHSWSRARDGEEHQPGRYNDLAAWLLEFNEEPGDERDAKINRRGYAPKHARDNWRELAYYPRRLRRARAEAMEDESRDAYGEWYTNGGAFGS